MLAQDQNLLVNPGFEDPYVTVQGDPPRKVAQGWSPWNVAHTADMPSFQNTQPEYGPAAPDTTRIRNGSNAQMYFSFFATHNGGVFQRVANIAPGTELRFSVYGYVWSTTFDDRSKSDEDGDVILQVGIDPTGGTDGTSANIVWSPAVEQYDAYREYAVIAKASGSAVTVFVRSIVGFPVQNNYIYLDDAALAPTTGSSQPAATNTTAPTNPPPPPTNTPVPTAVAVVPTNTLPPPPTITVVPPTNTAAPPASTVEASPTSEGALPTATTFPTNTPQQPVVTPAVPTSTPQGQLPTATPITPPTSTGGTGGATTPISADFPSTITHTVERGDTVAKLAALYGSTISAITQANGLDSNALIYVGQGLIIPVRLPAPATSTPTPTPVVVVVTATPGSATGGASGNLYVVRPGDTLYSIALRFNTTIGALAQLNGIVNPNRIQAGQRLVVPGIGGSTGGPVPTSPTPVANTSVPPTAVPPPPTPVQRQTYLVQPGDNLYRISLRFGVTMRALQEVNGIVNVNLLYAGQVLVIP